jgi:flagellin-like hook-associated protein FlgL
VKIGSNLSATRLVGEIGKVSSEIEKVSERLSSGLRINRASDDAAGLAISSSLNNEKRVLGQAIRNINDSISLISIAHGALSELSSITIRIKELAEQSSNGIYSTTQRQAFQKESDELIEEYSRIVASTTFNDRRVFNPNADRSFTSQVGSSGIESLLFSLGDQAKRLVGNGTFAHSATLSAGAGINAYNISGDFDGDGNTDIVQANFGGVATIYYGLGNGQFTAGSTVASSASYITVEKADIDNDGDLDLIFSDYDGNVKVVRNLGSRSWAAETTLATTGGSRQVSVADLNLDGKADIVVSDESTGWASIFLGNGDGTFQARRTVDASNDAYGLTLGDVNGDGIPDLVTTSLFGNQVTIQYGDGAGGFSATPSQTLGTQMHPVSVRLADFNFDGRLDLVVANNTSASVSVYLNQNGTFSQATNYTLGGVTNTRYLSVLDINGDGNLDIAAPGDLGGTAIIYGNGDGTFSAAITVDTGSDNFSVTMADFNNDGSIDIAATLGGSNQTNVMLANNRETFDLARQNLSTAQSARDTLVNLDNTLRRVTLEIGALGAYESRLSSALNTIITRRIEVAAASSRIADADIAKETASLIRANILRDVASSVLAQANLTPKLALTLLSQKE